MNDSYEYGHWLMAVVMSATFVTIAFSFTRPKSWRDWCSLGAFAAFVVALFAEMYGFPLTIYLLSGWLSSRHPELDLFAHDSGHLWQTLLGVGEGSPWAAHFAVLHLVSNVLIGGGVLVVMSAWPVLYEAQQEGRLATAGLYARIRHPQYVGFVVTLLGFLVQWPTIPTLAMFPVLIWMYVRLARVEEREIRARFGAAYDAYAAQVPRFIPRRGVSYEEPTPPIDAPRVSPANAEPQSEAAYG